MSMTDFSNGLKCQGIVKRKCVKKHGKKPALNPWTKYWMVLRNTQLLFFGIKYGAKALGSQDNRHHYKSRPSKCHTIFGWMVLCSDDPSRLDCFQLSNPDNGNSYRFQCESPQVARDWINHLKEAVKGYPQPEQDLINLDDDEVVS